MSIKFVHFFGHFWSAFFVDKICAKKRHNFGHRVWRPFVVIIYPLMKSFCEHTSKNQQKSTFCQQKKRKSTFVNKKRAKKRKISPIIDCLRYYRLSWQNVKMILWAYFKKSTKSTKKRKKTKIYWRANMVTILVQICIK